MCRILFFFQLSFIISCVEHFLSSISDSLVHRVTLNHVKQIMLNPIIRRSELRAKPISDHGLDSRAGRSFGSWACLFSNPHEGVSLRFFPFSYLHFREFQFGQTAVESTAVWKSNYLKDALTFFVAELVGSVNFYNHKKKTLKESSLLKEFVFKSQSK